VSDRVSKMFPRPAPYVVQWLDREEDRYRAITTYSREVADKVYDDLVALVGAGNRPTMWQGEMVIRDDATPKAVAFS
jgi:hypothetical protein